MVIGTYGHHNHIGVLLGCYARIREGDNGGYQARTVFRERSKGRTYPYAATDGEGGRDTARLCKHLGRDSLCRQHPHLSGESLQAPSRLHLCQSIYRRGDRTLRASAILQYHVPSAPLASWVIVGCGKTAYRYMHPRTRIHPFNRNTDVAYQPQQTVEGKSCHPRDKRLGTILARPPRGWRNLCHHLPARHGTYRIDMVVLMVSHRFLCLLRC